LVSGFISALYLGDRKLQTCSRVVLCQELRDIEGKKGAPFGQEIMQKATEGTIKEVTYWWPRPGSDKPLEKTTFYTKAGDQICGVGYYKG
jgi:hypothetical protein